MAFRKGSDQAEQAQKSAGSSFQKTEFFSIEDGELAILRFLTDTDGWIVVDQHQAIPTKKAPEGATNWPKAMGAVCRNDTDPITKERTFEYESCYICDYLVGTGSGPTQIRKPSARQWALACLREEVRENGKIVGYRDKVRTVTRKDKDGNESTEQEKAIVIVNMGYKNFFAALQGFAEFSEGTLLDLDYRVKRNGKGTATTYHIMPVQPPTMIEGEDGKPVQLDLRNAEHMARYATDLNLEDVVRERSTDEFYGKFFDPRVTVTDDGKTQSTGVEPEPKPSNDVNQADLLSELGRRVKGYGKEDAPTEEEPVAAAAGGMKDFG